MSARVVVAQHPRVHERAGLGRDLRRVGDVHARRPGAVVVASTAADGWPALAARSDNTFERWRPTAMPAWWSLDLGTAQPCNACTIAAHNLGSVAATVVVQSSPDATAWTNSSATVAVAAAGDGPLLLLYPSVTARPGG